MSETTTTTDPIIAATVAEELRRYPDGLTARKIAGQANLGLAAVGDVLTEMEAAGTVTRTPGEATGKGNRRAADVWTLPADAPATPDAAGTTVDAASDTAPAPGETTPDTEASVADVSDPTDTTAERDTLPEAPVSGAPVGSPDHYKIVMVAGVLGDHPDGVSAAQVADESGLRAGIVGRVLAAMEAAGAAGRTPGDESGVELWTRGEADLATVSLAAVPAWAECPTCGHRTRVRSTVGTRRVSTAPGQNSDGQRTLAKGELETMVREFLRAHPGHEFNAGTIAREIGRSSGAVGNALAKLVISGAALLVKDAPMTYAAPAPAPAEAGAQA